VSNEQFISHRECDIKHNNINNMIDKLEEKLEKLESKFWWIITLLISNLVGIIILFLKLR
jgi:hypothetical protein